MAKKKSVKKISKKSVKKTKTKAKRPAKKAPKAKRKVSTPTKKVSLLSRIAAAQEELEKARRKSEREGEKFFKEAVKEIFKEFPKLKSFSWNQYTPHWNDGDACTFGCHIDGMIVNDEESEDFWTLQSLHELLSCNHEKKRKEINEEIAKAKEPWQIENLKGKLKDLDRDPAEVEEKYLVRKKIYDLLSGIDEAVYENMFGEGTVKVTRDGIEVSECEHD